MAELYDIGSNRVVYRAESFTAGKTVTAYFWNPSLAKSALQTFTEIELGLYYLDYNFASVGTYIGLFYENGVAKTTGIFRVIALPTTINEEIVDALNVDTHGEPSTPPAASSSIVEKLSWLFALARNKIKQTSTQQTIRNDADDADIGTADVGDDSVTATRGKFT